ncbi:hypothetical protein DFP72DRAFT_264504 [Ephemerocybe angulata]|uniref:Uncharacterized protein n=1 Tax=Ephemerocybe angulata TaxID=980116 RepID=A0A8H6I3T0_9AGAR|nr:hypothetical protein DFP72DRAFT_264504 [Tulosesus angulatus]
MELMDVEAQVHGKHATHRRGTTGDETITITSRTEKLEDGKFPCSPLVDSPQRNGFEKLWNANPHGYYTTFYKQFTSIIMISTFTGGVQAAVLSFMNNILSNEPLKVELFHQDPSAPSRTLYTPYSLGLMLGLLAVVLNLTVAAIAAVNAALTCHFSMHPLKSKPSMEARILFCMIVQFGASGLAGISLVLLCFKLDSAFTCVAATLFFGGILMSPWHLISLFGSEWFIKLQRQPLQACSLVISTIAFLIDVVSPTPASWFTFCTYGTTLTYHILAVLHKRSTRGDRPRRLALFGAVLIALGWIGSIVVTILVGMKYRQHEDGWEWVLRRMSLGFSGLRRLCWGRLRCTIFG